MASGLLPFIHLDFMRKLRLLALLASFCVFAQPAWASTVIYRTDAQLVALSERVVHGRVIGQRTARAGGQGRIYTVTTLQVIEDLTGLDGEIVEIWGTRWNARK